MVWLCETRACVFSVITTSLQNKIFRQITTSIRLYAYCTPEESFTLQFRQQDFKIQPNFNAGKFQILPFEVNFSLGSIILYF